MKVINNSNKNSVNKNRLSLFRINKNSVYFVILIDRFIVFTESNVERVSLLWLGLNTNY